MRDIVRESQERRERDAWRFRELDQEQCLLCGAQGPDKRSLWIDCFYAVHEVVPEAIDLSGVGGDIKHRGYYLLICKSCRARLLAHLEAWRTESVALRELPKDSDGDLLQADEPGRDIPVRVHGATVMMTAVEYRAYCQARGLTDHTPVRPLPEPPST